MILTPTPVDLWLATHIAKLLHLCPTCDLAVQSAIHHEVLGGFWYAMALFIFWVKGAKQGEEGVRRRLLTILFACIIGILLSLIAQSVISWPPPSRITTLAGIYSRYLEPNININSFPSQSTMLYTIVAAGIFSLNEIAGSLLWLGVVLLIALPRMYVGGHYLSDIIAGFILGLAGYLIARCYLEAGVVHRIQQLMLRSGRIRIVGEIIVFAWVLQVALEFRDALWLISSSSYVLHRLWRL